MNKKDRRLHRPSPRDTEVKRSYKTGNILTETTSLHHMDELSWPHFKISITVYPNQTLEPEGLRELAVILCDFADEVEPAMMLRRDRAKAAPVPPPSSGSLRSAVDRLIPEGK